MKVKLYTVLYLLVISLFIGCNEVNNKINESLNENEIEGNKEKDEFEGTLMVVNEEELAIALKEGEAKAEKTCAIKIAGIKKDAEWQDEIAKREIASLKAALKAKEEEAAELRSKLDNAYTRIQEMAIEQSKASTPRLVETTK